MPTACKSDTEAVRIPPPAGTHENRADGHLLLSERRHRPAGVNKAEQHVVDIQLGQHKRPPES